MEETKPDKRRQKHHSAQERARMVGEYRGSGLGIEDYARGAGISDWTLRRWLKEHRRQQRAQARGDRSRRLVPVMIGPEMGDANRIEVVLAEGVMLRAPVTIGAAHLEALVAAVRRAC